MRKAFILILFVVLSGCNQHRVKQSVQRLDDAITIYGISLRWAQYDDAYRYHLSFDGVQPTVNLDALEEVSITRLEVTEKVLNEDYTKAYVKTDIDYFYKTQGVIKKLTLNQTWWLNEATGRWHIDGAFPGFK